MGNPFAKLKPVILDLPQDYTSLSSQSRRQVREQYIQEQEGLCHHCGDTLFRSSSRQVCLLMINEELFPENFFDHPIHLHHDHNTGLTIGAVHAQCNAALWQYHGE